jgi:hypothetical protein
VSGLWTPGGGDPDRPPADPNGGTGHASAGPQPSAEEVAAVRELHERLKATPAEDVIVNHAIGIWQLALVHLGVVTPPSPDGEPAAPDLASAGLAIDALAALTDGLADRLGEGEEMLRDALQQAQMLYVQIAEAADG